MWTKETVGGNPMTLSEFARHTAERSSNLIAKAAQVTLTLAERLPGYLIGEIRDGIDVVGRHPRVTIALAAGTSVAIAIILIGVDSTTSNMDDVGQRIASYNPTATPARFYDTAAPANNPSNPVRPTERFDGVMQVTDNIQAVARYDTEKNLGILGRVSPSQDAELVPTGQSEQPYQVVRRGEIVGMIKTVHIIEGKNGPEYWAYVDGTYFALGDPEDQKPLVNFITVDERSTAENRVLSFNDFLRILSLKS